MKQFDLKEVSNKMLSELAGISRASQNTIEAYTRDLDEFISFCEAKNILSINKVSENTIRHFVIHLSENDSGKSTISRKLSTLRHLFLFAVRNDLIDKNPVAKIPNPKVKRKLPETINIDSYPKIFSLVDEKNEVHEAAKLKAIFELLYGCALRVSELCSLNFGDIDFHSMSIRVLGKGAKVRIVPLGSKSANVMEDYLKTLEGKINSFPLFTDDSGERISRHYVYRQIKKYLSMVTDIEKRSPHILRHSAATHMLDNEADIMAVLMLSFG